MLAGVAVPHDCTRHRKRGFLFTCSETERETVLCQNYKNCNDSERLPTLNSAPTCQQ